MSSVMFVTRQTNNSVPSLKVDAVLLRHLTNNRHLPIV